MLENRTWSGCELFGFAVTFCEEGVDWNLTYPCTLDGPQSHLLWGRCGLKCNLYRSRERNRNVTFCEEGVDWNAPLWSMSETEQVTFCEEGVDWNVAVFPWA